MDTDLRTAGERAYWDRRTATGLAFLRPQSVHGGVGREEPGGVDSPRARIGMEVPTMANPITLSGGPGEVLGDDFGRGVEEGYDVAATQARQRRLSATERAEEAYSRAYLSAVDLVEEINELLQDLPAPSETFTPDWERVGSLVEVTRQLEQVIAILTPDRHPGERESGCAARQDPLRDAAPDLLAACRMALAHMWGEEIDGPTAWELDQTLRAAITIAQGGSDGEA